MNATIIDLSYPAIRREHTLDVTFERFTSALESLLGRMDVDALREIATAPAEEARRKLASFVGPSDFSLFQKLDHGGLLAALGGRRVQAATYVFGNALIAIEMTKYEPRVGLYVPPRLYVRSRDTVAETAVEASAETGILVTYDVPSATFAQFGSAEVDAVAQSLDGKVEKLIADAARIAAAGSGA
jgi:hypothetical protein